MRQNFLICLSFANICFLRVWSELLTYRRWDTYLMATPPKPVEYFALIANVVMWACVLTGLATLARRVLSGRNLRFGEMALVAGMFLPLNALRAVLSIQFPLLKSPLFELLGTRGAIALFAALGLVGLTIVVFYHQRAARIVMTVLTALSPFCAVTFGQALWKAAHYDETQYHNNPTAAVLPAAAIPRVVWVIADEWDYRLTFEDRDPTLKLPEIDRLRSTSLFLSDAAPPGWETPISIPGYYTGKLVNYVLHEGPRELGVAFHGDPRVMPLSGEESVFGRARGLGANTALLDWYHPTCRILSGLTYCKWWPMAMQHNSMGEGFWQVLPNQARSLVETNIFSLFGRPLTADQQTRVYLDLMSEARQLIGNREYGFILIHLPVPHAPHAYDRKTGTFTLGNSPFIGYLDSLALLDRTVGDLRRTMEQAGVWDATTVLFTSDHMYRDAERIDGKMDGRIPYLLKLAGQRSGDAYAPHFNAVLTADLLLDVMRGEVRDAASATAWIERNRTRQLNGQPPAPNSSK